MAAYVIVEVDVTNPGEYEGYKALVPGTLQKYGGRFKVRGGKVELLEGENEPKRVVVLEFDSVEAAKRWYRSPEYMRALAIRQRAAKARLMIVEGVPDS